MKQKEPLSRMRRKIDREDGFQEGELMEVWSKKKVGIALLGSLVVLGGLGYAFVNLGEGALSTATDNVQVLGQKTSEEVKLPTRDDIENTLESAQEELSKISSENVTASDAAIQKVIQDLQSIQGGGKQPLDVVCELVCKK